MEFLDIEITKKRYQIILIVSLIIVVIYLALTMSSLLVFKSYKLGSNTTVSNEDMNMHIDVLETDAKKIEIAGWAYKEKEPLNSINSRYVLKNQETGKMYLMRTKMEENINIEDPEYKKSGMHAQCLLLGMPKGIYDIYVLYQNNDEDLLAFTLISTEIK